MVHHEHEFIHYLIGGGDNHHSGNAIENVWNVAYIVRNVFYSYQGQLINVVAGVSSRDEDVG